MNKILLLSLSLMLSSICSAEEISAATKAEIAHLFSYLGGSGCEFNRNGTWYTAAEAVAHINKKYEYLQDKKLLTTTESFIEKAASESSLSHKAYQVRCNGQLPQPSAEWFGAELQKYRKQQGQ